VALTTQGQIKEIHPVVKTCASVSGHLTGAPGTYAQREVWVHKKAEREEFTSGGRYTSTVAADGSYTVEGLEPGTYSVLTDSNDSDDSIKTFYYGTANGAVPASDNVTISSCTDNKTGIDIAVTPPNTYKQIILSPDLSGDKRGDVLGLKASGELWMFPTSTTGALGAGSRIATGLTGALVYAPGDWNRDGKNDVIAVTDDGNMWLYPGLGAGKLGAKKQIGNGWTDFIVVPAGDLTKDGNADLLAIKQSTGDLHLYAGNGKGGFKFPYPKVGNGWGGYDLYAAGDLTKDGKNDILSVDSVGDLRMYAGNGNGTFKTRVQVGNGWGAYSLAAGADLTGDGISDIVGRDDATGILYFYRGTGGGKFATKKQIATGW
jgi:hypothetical protein